MAASDVCSSIEKESMQTAASQTIYENDVYSCLREITGLVTAARLQAKEAEIRARYSAEFAERAISEARTAHQVSETLAKTSRVVATLALEFSNYYDYENISLEGSNVSNGSNTSGVNCDNALQNSDRFDHTDKSECEDASLLLNSTELNADDKSGATSNDWNITNESNEADVKETDDVINQPRVKADDKSDGKSDANVGDGTLDTDQLSERMNRLEMKRKMLLYKDSKLVNGLRQSNEKGDMVGDEGQVTDTLSEEKSDPAV